MNNVKPVDQEFPLAFNSYAAFDATSLKRLMQQRLTENGTFTDQVFEGSNFNNLLDVVAYSYNVLLYYLNQTSNESIFSNVQLYENMNKIVKLLNYKPVGNLTSILGYDATANENLPIGVYTIPRFSYFTINDIYYSFNTDLTFVKSTSGAEKLTELSEYSLLYQGRFIEFPISVSNGENFEEVSIVSVDEDGNNEQIDHNNIFVFIRESSGIWKEWKRVDNIFLERGNSEAFEVRFNENQRYNIKFGNNVTGKKLVAGSLIAIYYLNTDKNLGVVGAGTLDDNQLFFFNTEQYNTIFNDVRGANSRIITLEEANNISFTNKNASTNSSDLENTEQIRVNAPNYFKQQGRLVTTDDFISYLKTGFANIISDVTVVNNWEYLDEHVRYLYNIGLKDPGLDSRVMLNQVSYADSCNFNNLYIYAVPKILSNNDFSFERGYLGAGIKDYILNKVQSLKMSTVELVFQDPVFLAIGFGVASQEEVFNKQLGIDVSKESKLTLGKSSKSGISNSEIIRQVKNIFTEYFSFTNTKLGQIIDVQELTQKILNIEGVENISTSRNNINLPGLSLLSFNSVYSNGNEDIEIITQNIKLPYFKIPYWFDYTLLDAQIQVVPADILTPTVREY
jgi:hypothetical protein